MFLSMYESSQLSLVTMSMLTLPAESHIKYIFSLIYIGHYEQNDVCFLSAKLFVTN